MKQSKARLCLLAGALLITIAVAVWFGISSRPSGLKVISMEELEELLREKDPCIVFCKQDSCSGCKRVEEILLTLSKKSDCEMYVFDNSSQSAKELLYHQYGLAEVPAIIRISSNQINVYKGVLTSENIEKIIETENVVYERFTDVSGISYKVFSEKMAQNADFFVYFGTESCSDCKSFRQILKYYIDENPYSGLYFVDLSEIKNGVTVETYEEIIDTYYIKWIPLVLHIKNGIELSRYEYPYYEYREEPDNEYPTSSAALDFFQWMDEELRG